MRNVVILILFLICHIAHAKVRNDYGVLLSEDKFSTHCILSDIGFSGLYTVDFYSNGEVSCKNLYRVYQIAYTQIRDFLQTENYIFDSNAPQKILIIRIITLADLNNPDNFSNTDKKCMYDIDCSSGAYVGRTFFSRYSNTINVYVAYNVNIENNSQYAFASTLKHELMHAILYRYGWHYSMSEYEEEKLILRFLNWTTKK